MIRQTWGRYKGVRWERRDRTVYGWVAFCIAPEMVLQFQSVQALKRWINAALAGNAVSRSARWLRGEP